MGPARQSSREFPKTHSRERKLQLLNRALVILREYASGPQTYQNVLLHRSIGGGSRSRRLGSSTLIGVAVVGAGVKVVRHLRIELLGRLLRRARAASSASSPALVPAPTSGLTGLLSRSTVLVRGGRLGLSLGLGGALSERLGLRDHVGSLRRANYDFDLHSVSIHLNIGSSRHRAYLDGAVVNEETVQLLESKTSAAGLAEDDVGNATALRVGPIGQLHLLDTTNRLSKVFLCREEAMLVIQRVVRYRVKSDIRNRAAGEPPTEPKTMEEESSP